MQTLNHPLLNFYPGRIVSANDMNSIPTWMLGLLSDAIAISQRPDGYGLIAVASLPFQLTLAGDLLQLHSLVAVTPGGRIVVQHPSYSPEVTYRIEPPSQMDLIVAITVGPGWRTWNMPWANVSSLHDQIQMPVYSLDLLPAENINTLITRNSDALPIGRIIFRQGAWYKDETYLPPCLHLKATDYLWHTLLQTNTLWERMQKATGNIVRQTAQVPYNAPMGDLHRLAVMVWQYLYTQRPGQLYLRERSHPADLFQTWAGLASLFSGYFTELTLREGEIFGLLERYSRNRPGYRFDAREAFLAAYDLARYRYQHINPGEAFYLLSQFLLHIGQAWIFLGEAQQITLTLEQRTHKLEK